MWYEQHATALDYSKPIVAISKSTGKQYLLMPSLAQDGSYVIAGYNWFDVKMSKFNSCRTWKTPAEAVRAYEGAHKIKNVEIDFT